MFVIEVIPITKTVGIETLSYFTAHKVPLGALVTVPVRTKSVRGIVVEVRQAIDIKSEIKNSTFTLKKLGDIKSVDFFSNTFMETVDVSAQYFATTSGSVLNILVPDYILKNIPKLKRSSTPRVNAQSIHEQYVVQGDDEERYSTWKSLIRQEFAKKKSLYFLFPTIEEATHAHTILEKGIEGYAHLLHGTLTSKKIVETWNTIVKEEHPVVIIATGGFLSLPRNDIDTLIIERESSRFYKIQRRPFLDIRYVAEIFARKHGMKLYYSDSLLRIDTLYRHATGELLQSSPFKFRSLSTARDTLIDMREARQPNRIGFKILSPEVERLITRTKEESERMIILATRRGLAPSTVCGDCQNIVTCNTCNTPIVLHRTDKIAGCNDESKQYFLCHRCGERRSAEEYCKICGSWKLGTIGIGIDLVADKIKDKFPDITLIRIDSDTTPNDTSIHHALTAFYDKPGSILLGTEMMIPYLHEKVENTAVVSIDSLFSVPDFRMPEKILSLLTSLRIRTTREFIVQTRKADEKVLEYGLKGNLSDFYKTAIEEREKFSYPPYSTLIKLTLEGKKDEIVKTMEELQTTLEPNEVEVFPAFTYTAKGSHILHGLIRLKKGTWIDDILLSKLRTLPPSVTIKVDPESLL